MNPSICHRQRTGKQPFQPGPAAALSRQTSCLCRSKRLRAPAQSGKYSSVWQEAEKLRVRLPFRLRSLGRESNNSGPAKHRRGLQFPSTATAHRQARRVGQNQHKCPGTQRSTLLHRQCGLTPRSSRAPTAGHQARSGGTRYIFASPGLASHRWCRLNSNVRRQKPPLWRFVRLKKRGLAPSKPQAGGVRMTNH